eukprot:1196174-Prorocentrum_minimum.AAC.3
MQSGRCLRVRGTYSKPHTISTPSGWTASLVESLDTLQHRQRQQYNSRAVQGSQQRVDVCKG